MKNAAAVGTKEKKAVGAFYEAIKTFSRNKIAALRMIMQFLFWPFLLPIHQSC